MPIPNSIDDVLLSAADNGLFNRLLYFPVGGGGVAPTAATTNSGSVSILRNPFTYTAPSVGDGFSGIWPVTAYIIPTETNGGLYTLATEFILGTLTVSGNSFASGVSMPVKNVAGEMIQTATLIPVLFVSAALTATTPVVTITYTDQDGNTGQTCTMTLPTSPVIDSCYSLIPHLANGDTGVRAVTNMSISIGSAGTLKVMGLLPICDSHAIGATPVTKQAIPIHMSQPRPIFLIEPNEVIALYQLDPTGGNVGGMAHLAGVAA